MSHPDHAEKKYIANNKKAFHDYEILEKLEAGMVLVGCEVKSIRQGHITIRESYARIMDNELWLLGANILPYKEGNRENVEQNRTRKLLLSRRQLNKWMGKTKDKGLVLVPLGVYLSKGLVKIEIGLAKPRKLYDKRHVLKEKEVKRDIERGMKYKG